MGIKSITSTGATPAAVAAALQALDTQGKTDARAALGLGSAALASSTDFASALDTKTINFTAADRGRYQTVGTGIVVTDPAPFANGSYMVRVDSGTAIIGGVTYSASRFDVVRYCDGAAWSTKGGVITGGLSVDGLTRKLLASYTVQQDAALSSCTYDSATKTFTSNGHALANGTPIKLLAGTGVIPTGFSAYVADTTGPVYFVVGAATNTFQLSATVGGAAVTTSDSGTVGWTATPFLTAIVSISGLNITAGQRIRVTVSAPNGSSFFNAASTLGIKINGDANSKYRNGTSKQAYMGVAATAGNLYSFMTAEIRVSGGCVTGLLFTNGNYGTDRTAGNSSPVSGAQGSVYDSESTTLTITSLVINSFHSGAGYVLKPGTIISIEQEA